MARLTKKQKEAVAKIDKNKLYSVEEASSLVKEITNAKFDASIDIAVRLGVDPRKANQMVRGVVSLPHGTGKNVKVLALVTPDTFLSPDLDTLTSSARSKISRISLSLSNPIARKSVVTGNFFFLSI